MIGLSALVTPGHLCQECCLVIPASVNTKDGFVLVTFSSNIPGIRVCAESVFSLLLFFIGLFFTDFSFGADVFFFFTLGGFDMPLLLFAAFSFVVTFFKLVMVEADAFTFFLFNCFLL